MVDDFFAQSLAEVIEVARRRVIGERRDHDGVAAGKCGGDRSPDQHRRVASLQRRSVTALRQLDDPFVRTAFLAVVANQLGAEAACLDPDDRIGSRIERLFLTEHLDADHVLLQLVTTAGERLFDDEREETLETVDLLKGRAGEDALQLVAHCLVGFVRGRRRLAWGHAPDSSLVGLHRSIDGDCPALYPRRVWHPRRTFSNLGRFDGIRLRAEGTEQQS